MEDGDERQDWNALESVGRRTTDQDSSALYCTYPWGEGFSLYVCTSQQ